MRATVRPGRPAVLAAAVVVLVTLLSSVSPVDAADRTAATASTGDTRTFGAAPLGTTQYPIPSGAKFVAPWGSDSNAGTSGAPLRTLAKAVSSAPAGSTIVLRGGTYRESVTIGRRLTLQPHPNEAVILSGSKPETGWVGDGDDWRKDGWYGHVPPPSVHSRMIDPAYPASRYPDMVFVDGVPQRQVLSRSSVVPGAFYVDAANHRVYVGTNPNGRNVEVTFLRYGIQIIGSGSGTIVRGIQFHRFASNQDIIAPLRINAGGVTVENCRFVDNAWAGLSLIGSNHQVRRNLATGNGLVGIQAWSTSGLVFTGNLTNANNREHFGSWANAGVKITQSSGGVLRDNMASWNIGSTGLWVDSSSRNFTIVDNVTRGNGHAGIQYEVSSAGLIASNVVVDNAMFGIYLSESQDVNVWNNTVLRNRNNLRILEGSRHTSDPSLSWDCKNLVIRNNVFGGGSAAMLSTYDLLQDRTAEQMGITTNFNAWWRPSSSSPSLVAEWSDYPRSLLRYSTVGAFRNAEGQETTSWAVDGGSNPFVTSESANDYQVPSWSPAAGRGTPLPSWIATQLGLPAGVPIDPGVHY